MVSYFPHMASKPATRAQVQKVRADLKGDIEGARSELKADIQRILTAVDAFARPCL